MRDCAILGVYDGCRQVVARICEVHRKKYFAVQRCVVLDFMRFLLINSLILRPSVELDWWGRAEWKKA